MKNIKTFGEFKESQIFEGALGTAAASLGMRGKGSSSYRNTSGKGGDKNEWRKLSRKGSEDRPREEEEEDEYCTCTQEQLDKGIPYCPWCKKQQKIRSRRHTTIDPKNSGLLGNMEQHLTDEEDKKNK
jgi:hypothetical protein